MLTAAAIQNAPRKSAAVLGWAQSINQWMPANGGDDADSDVIVRAKGASDSKVSREAAMIS